MKYLKYFEVVNFDKKLEIVKKAEVGDIIKIHYGITSVKMKIIVKVLSVDETKDEMMCEILYIKTKFGEWIKKLGDKDLHITSSIITTDNLLTPEENEFELVKNWKREQDSNKFGI